MSISYGKRSFRKIEINEIQLIFIYLLLICQGGMLAFNDRCSSFCCCLYSTSSFRLWRIEQRADSTYWIHKNNKPIKNFGMNNSITSPEETISLISLHIWKTTSEQKHPLVAFVEGTDHYSAVWLVYRTWKCTLQAISCSHTVLWSPHRGGERLYNPTACSWSFIRQTNMSSLYLKQMDSPLTISTRTKT